MLVMICTTSGEIVVTTESVIQIKFNVYNNAYFHLPLTTVIGPDWLARNGNRSPCIIVAGQLHKAEVRENTIAGGGTYLV